MIIVFVIADEEKEEEMQIGFPTDVKHVAHIGNDGPATNAPSWVRSHTLLRMFVHNHMNVYSSSLFLPFCGYKPQMNDFKPQEHEQGQVVSRGNSNKYNPQGLVFFFLCLSNF